MKILHLSDLHFHRNDGDNQEVTAALANVLRKYQDHLIVITGDIVDDGHEKQYEKAFEQLKEFKGRLFIAPGNHDFGALGNFYSKEMARRFDEMLSKPLEQGGTFGAENKPVINVVKEGQDSVMLIGLDTNLETDHPFDFACGEVGETQLAQLTTILASPIVPEMKRVLFFHHHPFVHNNPFMELKDGPGLVRAVYGKVDVILFGHKHEMMKWENRWNLRYILASDNSPGKRKAGEITIKDGAVKFKYVNI